MPYKMTYKGLLAIWGDLYSEENRGNIYDVFKREIANPEYCEVRGKFTQDLKLLMLTGREIRKKYYPCKIKAHNAGNPLEPNYEKGTYRYGIVSLIGTNACKKMPECFDKLEDFMGLREKVWPKGARGEMEIMELLKRYYRDLKRHKS